MWGTSAVALVCVVNTKSAAVEAFVWKTKIQVVVVVVVVVVVEEEEEEEEEEVTMMQPPTYLRERSIASSTHAARTNSSHWHATTTPCRLGTAEPLR